ncbi:MAG: thioesterase family protein [bacterium]
MKYEKIEKIYYHDTDSYQIAYHGTYVRWFEAGRIELCALLGIDIHQLQDMDILLPVVDLNCRYRTAAKLFDELKITTTIEKLTTFSITFSHDIENITTGAHTAKGTTTIVVTDKNGKLARKMPVSLYENFEKGLNS